MMIRLFLRTFSHRRIFIPLGFGFCFFLFLLTVHTRFTFAATKEEVIKKYERVIVKSNQMNIYGYDLSGVTFKLKRATEILVANQLEQADKILDEIRDDLKAIEAKGPERLRRERALAWLEIFGDFIQQIAIFAVMTLILIRFRFVKFSMAKFKESRFSSSWRLVVLFSIASMLGAFVGLIRYGQSSWAFIDLQILLIGLSGFLGGIWVGIATGMINGLFRLLIVPTVTVYSVVPFAIGTIAGLFRSLKRGQALKHFDVVLGGLMVGLIHSLFMYVPIYAYLPFKSFLTAVFFLSVAECGVIYLFFMLAWQTFKEEKRKETERELIRTRLRFLQAQINPHFLFNTLNTIAAVCGEEHAERARNLIVQLSTFFRRLTKAGADAVPLKEEFEYIDAYLNIEKARFGDRLAIQKEIQVTESGLSTPVPILVIQPLVENAVKHGLSKKSGGGKITMKATEQDSYITIEIEDTGVGMSEEAQRKIFSETEENSMDTPEHTGIGLRNIRERMAKRFGDQFQISLTSVPNQGTKISVRIPKP